MNSSNIMLAVTHLAASLLLIQLMNLDRNDAFVALLFGVFIDLDHLLGFERYVHSQGITAAFDTESLMSPEGQWKSIMHRPVAIMVVAPLSIATRLAAPLIFWGVHISMDYAQEGYLGNFSEIEALLLGFLGLTLFTLRYSRFLESSPVGTPQDYFRSEMSHIKLVFKRSPKPAAPST